MGHNAQTINDLYDGKKYIKLKFSNSDFEYNLLLHGRDGTPDCYITSIAANFYARTEMGMSRKRYASFNIMLREVRRKLKEIFGKDNEIKNVEIVTIKKGEHYPIW